MNETLKDFPLLEKEVRGLKYSNMIAMLMFVVSSVGVVLNTYYNNDKKQAALDFRIRQAEMSSAALKEDLKEIKEDLKELRREQQQLNR